jgi:hypothetical protein
MPRAIFLWGHELQGSLGTVGEAGEMAATAAYCYAATKHRGWRLIYALAVCDAAVAQARALGEQEVAAQWEARWLVLLRAALQARMEAGLGEELAETGRVVRQ